MKKTLVLCFLALFILVGCEKKPVEQNTIDYIKISTITDTIDILYSDLENIDFEDEEILNEMDVVRADYDSLSDEEKKLVTNYDNLVVLEQLYEQYLDEKAKQEEEQQKIAVAVEEAINYVRESIPSKTNGENIDLPAKYTSKDGIDVYYSWSTNDPYTLTNQGEVTQPRIAGTKVTLTAVCRCGSITQKVNKVVSVNYLPFEELPDQPVFAYYYSNQVALSEIERKTVNVINLSFGEIDNNGNVYVTGLKYDTVLKERKHGIRVCFSVQNKTGFQTWTTTAERRNKLAKSFLDVCEQYHFDGVDIDWEYPNGNEVNNYVEFMKVLYEKFKARNSNYLVTSAMYGGNGVSKYNAGESHKYMDYIHLMTYDLNDPNLTTHLTSVSGAESTVNYYTKAGVPKNKLVIGCAFYGKEYTLSKDTDGFYYKKPLKKPESINYSEIKSAYLKYLNNPTDNINVERAWDSSAKAPYLCITKYNDDKTVKEKIYITYDDPESISMKCNIVKTEGLGGIMMWEMGYADRQDNELMQAIYDVFYK